VDDLIFSIKMSTAAKHLGVELYFERSRDRVLQTVKDKQPTLVIFDLNSARLEPMAAIGALKADPALAGIRTLGFVSHVDADTIEAARQAGIDQVLARSAFADRLGDILTATV
jgi:CheY-like chemotaxis protein